MDLEINAQQNQVKLLESRLRVAQNDAERFNKLEADLVSPQEREHKGLLLEQAERELDSSRSLLEKLVKSQELSREAAAAKVRSAQANVARVEPLARIPALEANVNLAAEKARLAQIVAPTDGTVLRISIQPGEMIGQRPIMQFGALNQMEVVAEVYETEVSRVAPGQPVEITTGTKEANYRNGALPAPLQGRVVRVGSVVAQNEILGIDPAERADARVVSVTILIEKPSDAARRLVNLQVNAAIDTSKTPAPAAAAATTSNGRAPEA
jgi:HlyD family secretion protein